MKGLLTFLIVTYGALLLALSLSGRPRLLEPYSFSQAVYDHDFKLLRLTLSQDDKYRIRHALEELSPKLIQATLLQEDQYFYWHPGVNWFSLARAAVQTYWFGSRRVGASTITMQLARLMFGIDSRSLSGKFKQIWAALRLEWHYSKAEILSAYLNLAPYGGNVEGVGAASLVYFHKRPQALTLPETLALVTIPQHPGERVPRGNLLKDNTHLKRAVLQLWSRWLIKYPADLSKQTQFELPLKVYARHELPFLAPHFVGHVLTRTAIAAELITTLDLHMQRILERQLTQYVEQERIRGIHNASALLVDSRDMSVKALVGSANFFAPEIQGQVNGTLARRSPGSALKPFIYALGMDQGLIHPMTMLKDSPMSFGEYDPENFDQNFSGPVLVTEALIRSRNLPAIYVANRLRSPTLYEFLQNAAIDGLHDEPFYGLALVLGGAEVTMEELVSLYAMLAKRGILRPLRYLQDEPVAAGDLLLSPEASFLTLDILRKNPRPAQGFYSNWTQGAVRVAWKTGTSYAFRDAWSLAVVGPYVLGVWVGNFDGRSNPIFVGREAAAPLMFRMIDALKADFPGEMQRSLSWLAKITQVDVCSISGGLPTDFCPHTVKTLFIPGKSPITLCPIHREILLDLDTGLRMCRETARTERQVYEFWPSDLLALFERAGIPRRTPPPFAPQCSTTEQEMGGLAPEITSPKRAVLYQQRLNTGAKEELALMAVADADVEKLYWFLGHSYLGAAIANEPFYWKLKAGQYTLKVVDDHGRSASRDFIVQLVQ